MTKLFKGIGSMGGGMKAQQRLMSQMQGNKDSEGKLNCTMADEPQQRTGEAEPKRIHGWAIFGVVITFIGVVAACLAIPGMPKLFHFDKAEPSPVAASTGTKNNRPTSFGRPPLSATGDGPTQPKPQPSPSKPVEHKSPTEHLHKEQTKRTTASASPTEPTSAPAQAAPASEAQQHCETGSVCLGDNHGTVNVNNVPPNPPKREISDIEARTALQVLSRVGRGHAVMIFANASSKETAGFAFQLHQVLAAAGWQITPQAAQMPFFSGDGVVWKGKGFVCTGYLANDPIANTVIEAIKIMGFPCEERPVAQAYPGSTKLTLLVGTRGSVDD